MGDAVASHCVNASKFRYTLTAYSAIDNTLILFNALFIALGIFANLAFEEIGLDLYVVALLAFIAVGLFLTRRGQPILLYYSAAYVLGLIATFAYKGFAFV